MWVFDLRAVCLAHNLQLVLRRPAHLRKAQAAFDALQILARNLIAENMGLLIALVELFSRGSLVDTNHGHTNGPCSIES